MKIWIQSVSPIERRDAYRERLASHLAEAADPGTEFELHGTHATLRGEEYRSIFMQDARIIMGNAMLAEKRGFDAFAIMNCADPMLMEAREMVDIPVVSYLQSALLCMTMMGRKFGIIVPDRKLAPIWEDQITAYGYKDRLAFFGCLDQMKPIDHDRVFADRQFEEQRFENWMGLARQAVAAGAEVILPLASSWYLLLHQRGINEVDGVPLFDGITSLINVAQLMVKYRRMTGSFISRKLTYASPPRAMLEEALARNHNVSE